MEIRKPSADAASATYEIQLRGSPPQELRQRFPSMKVFTRRAETLLFRRVENPAELDELLEQLLSMGMVLSEVHALPLTATPRTVLDKQTDEEPDDDWL